MDPGDRLTQEFLAIWRRLHAGEQVDFDGLHVRVHGAKLELPTRQAGGQPRYFGGSSEIARDIAARYADVYLTWGERLADVAEKIEDVRHKAAALGRSLRYGIRLHVIVRETDAEAWAAADVLISQIDEVTIARAQAHFAQFDSEGQRRQLEIRRGGNSRSRASLEIEPNLWAGVGLVRPGAGTALVGNPETVAARMREYAALGIDTFILSGYPHLEEAYRVAELVFPQLVETTSALQLTGVSHAS